MARRAGDVVVCNSRRLLRWLSMKLTAIEGPFMFWSGWLNLVILFCYIVYVVFGNLSNVGVSSAIRGLTVKCGGGNGKVGGFVGEVSRGVVGGEEDYEGVLNALDRVLDMYKEYWEVDNGVESLSGVLGVGGDIVGVSSSEGLPVILVWDGLKDCGELALECVAVDFGEFDPGFYFKINSGGCTVAYPDGFEDGCVLDPGLDLDPEPDPESDPEPDIDLPEPDLDFDPESVPEFYGEDDPNSCGCYMDPEDRETRPDRPKSDAGSGSDSGSGSASGYAGESEPESGAESDTRSDIGYTPYDPESDPESDEESGSESGYAAGRESESEPEPEPEVVSGSESDSSRTELSYERGDRAGCGGGCVFELGPDLDLDPEPDIDLPEPDLGLDPKFVFEFDWWGDPNSCGMVRPEDAEASGARGEVGTSVETEDSASSRSEVSRAKGEGVFIELGTCGMCNEYWVVDTSFGSLSGVLGFSGNITGGLPVILVWDGPRDCGELALEYTAVDFGEFGLVFYLVIDLSGDVAGHPDGFEDGCVLDPGPDLDPEPDPDFDPEPDPDFDPEPDIDFPEPDIVLPEPDLDFDPEFDPGFYFMIDLSGGAADGPDGSDPGFVLLDPEPDANP